nr:wee1 protein kinase [Hymenolepis microstoma]
MLGSFESPVRESGLNTSGSYGRNSQMSDTSRLQELQNKVRSGSVESKQYYDIRIDFAKKIETPVSFVSTSSNQLKIGRTLFGDDSDESEEMAVEKEQVQLQSTSQPRLSYKSNLENLNKSNIASIVAFEVERAVEFDEYGIRPTRSTNCFADPESKPNQSATDPIYTLSSFSGSSFLQTYSSIDQISKSDSTTIYRARHRYESLFYAIKRVGCDEKLDEKYLASIKKASNEIQVLDILEHDNIVFFYTSWSEMGFTFLKLEYCVGGSLDDYLLRKNRQLKPSTAASIIEQIGRSLDYMYSQHRFIHGNIDAKSILIQITHREVRSIQKTVNLLIDAGTRCHKRLDNDNVKGVTFKLSSFGLAEKASQDIPELEVRKADIIGLAKIIISNVDLDFISGDLMNFVMVLDGKLKKRGFTANAVMDYLRQYAIHPELFVEPEAMDTS